ncbi:MAG: 50S ribosomal protein L25 [Armatimonadetes bacterium JP3_11]|jgi:large subunit ribosomal protein L25|nr:MAG: 50S ribosomal protein L25 [Armatimonadetes bacterium JP3_11]RMH07359.1 MAG: 50S ribosomal protein L25 [Armatimonadota bacterium]
MATTFSIKAEPRTLLGKKAKRLLGQGYVPGVVFRSNGESTPVQFEERSLGRVLHQAGTTHLIEVELNGEKLTTLLRAVDREPITARIRHVNLWAVAMDEPVETEVPIVLEGESLAVKSGGVLIHPVEKLRVKCLPTQIPEAIHVNLAALENFGDSIHLRDLQLPAGVQALDDPEITIASVAAPKETEEEEVAAAPSGEA